MERGGGAFKREYMVLYVLSSSYFSLSLPLSHHLACITWALRSGKRIIWYINKFQFYTHCLRVCYLSFIWNQSVEMMAWNIFSSKRYLQPRKHIPYMYLRSNAPQSKKCLIPKKNQAIWHEFTLNIWQNKMKIYMKLHN